MVQEVEVATPEEFDQKVSEYEKKFPKKVLVLFTGVKDSGGKSWCGDCNEGNRK